MTRYAGRCSSGGAPECAISSLVTAVSSGAIVRVSAQVTPLQARRSKLMMWAACATHDASAACRHEDNQRNDRATESVSTISGVSAVSTVSGVSTVSNVSTVSSVRVSGSVSESAHPSCSADYIMT